MKDHCFKRSAIKFLNSYFSKISPVTWFIVVESMLLFWEVQTDERIAIL